MQKITPFLWFDGNAEEAMEFYTAVFKESKVLQIARYPDEGRGPAGGVMTAVFELFGQTFIALNGGPEFKFNESVSFVVNCNSQEEVDYYWDKLSTGGQTSMCGWLKDKFGLSWQIVPVVLGELMTRDRHKGKNVMQAMLRMKKLIIKDLQDAYENA